MKLSSQICGNTASNKGGAIFVEGRPVTNGDDPTTKEHCFYQIMKENGTQEIRFISNFAANGGHDIYGTPLSSYCLVYDQQDDQVRSNKIHTEMFHFQPPENLSLSSISSDPQRVCLCDDSGIPRCDEMDSIFSSGYTLYPGEVFSLSLVAVYRHRVWNSGWCSSNKLSAAGR